MLTKAQIFDTVEELPEQISLDELIDKFIFVEKVNIGLEQSRNGMVCSEIKGLTNKASRFKGLLTNEEADKYHQYLQKARQEWERNI